MKKSIIIKIYLREIRCQIKRDGEKKVHKRALEFMDYVITAALSSKLNRKRTVVFNDTDLFL